MNFGLIPVAEASVMTLMKSINRVIINPIIFFLFALAMVYFLYGVAQYLLNPESEEVRKKSKSQMLYGVIGLFVMVAVFGIMNLILNTVGENKIKIHNSGDYEIVEEGDTGNSIFDTATNISESVDVTTGEMLNLSEKNNFTNASTTQSNFNQSPFGNIKYIENPLCWRKEIHVSASTEYKALQLIKTTASNDYLSAFGPAVANVKNMPLDYGVLVAYDPNTKIYHAWMDARAPKSGGTMNDCVLKIDTENSKELPLNSYVLNNPFTTSKETSYNTGSFTTTKNTSLGPSPLTANYQPDSFFNRIISSGVSSALQLARELALKNAFALLGKMEGSVDVNGMTVVYPTARILEERYIVNPQTGNYEYWVAIESAKVTRTVNEVTKTSPFVKPYEDNSMFIRTVDYALSKDPSTVRDLAINNAVQKLSTEISPNDMYTGVQLMIILEEKQIFNKDNGEYEYWIAIEGLKTVEGAKPVSQSLKTIPFTKIYESDASSYRAVDSGVSKDLSTAKDLAMNNALIKLGMEIGETSTGIQMVTILEEKQLFNSNTDNYEYWIALETGK